MRYRHVYGIDGGARLGFTGPERALIWQAGLGMPILETEGAPLMLTVKNWLETWPGKEEGAPPPNVMVRIELKRAGSDALVLELETPFPFLASKPSLVASEWLGEPDPPKAGE